MVRLMIASPLALALALLLFYGLALLTSTGDQLAKNTHERPVLDFLMVRQESAVEVRKRQLPPEPEEIVQQPEPKMPQLKPQTTASVSADLPNVQVPDIAMGIEVSLSPSLNNLAVPTPSLTMDTNPTVLSQIPPRYPSRALRRKQEGRVVVEFTITEQGTVKPGSVKVVESTPPGVFDKAVLRAIQRWRFQTREVDGQAVAFRARQELEFKLER